MKCFKGNVFIFRYDRFFLEKRDWGEYKVCFENVINGKWFDNKR